uniref:Uncharacterized protein n=1 Tax=Rhizobium leguminosarum bv. viciae TaxID=387 RepID=A0A0U3JP68_RHILV|nr:hypothetical protein [Rhizobium leguminosarum bv. viciae]
MQFRKKFGKANVTSLVERVIRFHDGRLNRLLKLTLRCRRPSCRAT